MDELLAGLAADERPVPRTAVRAVTCDSRHVVSGSLFVAITGTVFDGHEFIASAVERGAAAIVYENETCADRIPQGVAAVRVADTRRAAAIIADRFWDHPSGDLTLVGVTGTNGKTTTVHFVESIFNVAGYHAGMIGTLGRRVQSDTVSADRTTPDSMELQELLAHMRDAQVTHAAMEVSSHALDLDRTWGCTFAGAVFTNLTVDHLDWHGDLESYRRSKTRLFTDYADLARPEREMIGAINIDDEAGRIIAEKARCRVITYGLGKEAQIWADTVSNTASGSSFVLHWPSGSQPVRLRMVGGFNVLNALGAAACCHGLGMEMETIISGLEALTNVPGRMETVDRGQPFAVLVDYAHTPDAVASVLQTARELNPARLLCVLGCGGDRDTSKRPVMGRLATELADMAVITSDNPRSEDPMKIIADITAGISGDNYRIEPDRHKAIEMALAEAREHDIVLICGKGHETYQEFADKRRIHFDDREVAAEILEELGHSGRSGMSD